MSGDEHSHPHSHPHHPHGHPGALASSEMPVVFTAHSAESAYLREKVCQHAYQHGVVPVNPWMLNGYFLYGMVSKQEVRAANNTLLARCDELWVYGEVSDGVAVEIADAEARGQRVRYFSLDHYGEAITEVGGGAQ